MRFKSTALLTFFVTFSVILGCATMALAEGNDAVDPGTSVSATATEPTTPATTEPTAPATTEPTAPEPTTPEPTTPEPTVPATTAPTSLPSTTRAIDDAQLRWGINNESNNKAFAPGTFNFFSAGKLGDPGEGNKLVNASDQGATWSNGRPAGWKASDGDVAIEKYVNNTWKPATFAGLSTTSTGAKMTGANGFSNHEIVLSGGTGTVDRAKGTASIQWTGSFTVVYYSGYSFFYVTNPKLTIAQGVGKLTATLGGYGSSMDDLTKWEAVTPVPNVLVASFPSIALSSDRGFTAKPAYSKVAVSVPNDQTAQYREGASWGSFPQPFIDFQSTSGTGSYWYSSGGAADAHKIALPVTVSYAADDPVKVTPPKTETAKTPDIDNSAPEAPASPTGNPAVAPPVTAARPPVSAPLPVDSQVQASPATTQFRPTSTVTGIHMAADEDSTQGVWILGGVLLGAAALIALSPCVYTGLRRKN